MFVADLLLQISPYLCLVVSFLSTRAMPVQVDMGPFLFGFKHVGLFICINVAVSNCSCGNSCLELVLSGLYISVSYHCFISPDV